MTIHTVEVLAWWCNANLSTAALLPSRLNANMMTSSRFLQTERLFNQKIANEMSMQGNLIILCGHYKGIDQRVRDHPLSPVRDFCRRLRIDRWRTCCSHYLWCSNPFGTRSHQRWAKCALRLFPGRHLAAPIYTRPADYKGWKVPEILLSGNEAKIRQWEFDQAMERTRRLRPDLLGRIKTFRSKSFNKKRTIWKQSNSIFLNKSKNRKSKSK